MSVTFLLIRQVNIVELATFKKRTVGKQNRLLIRNNVDSLNVQICQKRIKDRLRDPALKVTTWENATCSSTFFWHICMFRYLDRHSVQNRWFVAVIDISLVIIFHLCSGVGVNCVYRSTQKENRCPCVRPRLPLFYNITIVKWTSWEQHREVEKNSDSIQNTGLK